MSVFNPNDPNKTLIPQTGNRQTPYNIGGKPPYGFVGTPAYNPDWSPGVPQSFVGPPAPGSPHEVALYERFDWDKSIAARQYQNPAFVGIGSSGVVPQWMQGADGTGVKRILRGYMRRSTIYPLSQPGLSDQQKATNARLYFMYNPSDITRQYVSYSILAGQASSDVDAQVNGGQTVPAMVTMSMELLFDRQEEVARFKDHPGVLVDLAVFDMLIGNNVTSYDDVLSRDATLEVGDAGATTAISRPTTTDTQTLKVGLDIYITIIMSPSLVFEGKVMEASALFQKFSHRMTPTRMTLSVTLLLNYTGKLQPTDTINAADQASAAWRRDNIAANKETVNPALKAASRDAALNLNYEGRLLAVQWAEQWTAEAGKRVNSTGPYAGTTGSYYAHSKRDGVMRNRCEGFANDDLVLADAAHAPPYFDCSSLCYRAYNVVGWADALHLGPNCAPPSDFFIQTALAHSDVWSYLELKGGSISGGDANLHETLSRNFNLWDPENTGQPGPNTGDMIVRKGADAAGHIAFIHSKLSGDSSNHRAWTWKLLHSCCPDEPVQYSKPITTEQIIFGGGNTPYSHIIRPHPIKS